MAFFSDTFTDSDSVELSSHTPDTGTSWTAVFQDSGKSIDIQSNRANHVSALNGSAWYSADVIYPSADYRLQWTQTGVPGTAAQVFFAFVRQTDIENMYAVKIAGGVTDSQLYKKVTGAE